MKRWKTWLIRALWPSLGCALLLAALCTFALLWVFSKGLDKSAAAYPIYILSAYTLTVWVCRVPGAVVRGKELVYRNRLGRRYLSDLEFRGRFSLLLSTGINACYALFKLGTGVYYRSFWFCAIAVYYLLLALMRGLLARDAYRGDRKKEREYRAVRLCGCLLFALTAALSVVTAQMVIDGRGYRYPGTLIFAAAFYAFYAVTTAVLNLLRFRKLESPVLSASKVLGLATALVSMLSLQTAMFDAFGEGFLYQRLMNALTGGAVCLSIFLMAVLMVVRATRQLKPYHSTRTRSIHHGA